MDRRTFVVHGATQLVFMCAIILGGGLLRAGVQQQTHTHGSRVTAEPNWSQLIASMDKMHTAMGAVEPSGKLTRRERGDWNS